MDLIVGLGNPGAKYADTRHNIGFMVVDRIAERAMTSIDKQQFGALVGKALVANRTVVLAKPFTYMNKSGHPTSSLRGYYNVSVPRIFVIHDDLDLSFGTVRVKVGGGHGGHNGLRSLIAQLGDPGFVRIRMGISRPPPGWETANYVLGKFSNDEKSQLESVIEDGVRAVEMVLAEGTSAAMNVFNQKK